MPSAARSCPDSGPVRQVDRLPAVPRDRVVAAGGLRLAHPRPGCPRCLRCRSRAQGAQADRLAAGSRASWLGEDDIGLAPRPLGGVERGAMSRPGPRLGSGGYEYLAEAVRAAQSGRPFGGRATMKNGMGALGAALQLAPGAGMLGCPPRFRRLARPLLRSHYRRRRLPRRLQSRGGWITWHALG
jgi:hypothetical protein